MERKKRLYLNKICPNAIGLKNVEKYEIQGEQLIIETKKNLYSAQNVHGTYGFLTRHI